MEAKKQFLNARPSAVQNLGEEVLGAARHNNDTYDNPEAERQAKERKAVDKEVKAQVEALKRLTVQHMPDAEQDLVPYLVNYETRLFQVQNMQDYGTACRDVNELKAFCLGKSSDASYNTLRLRFNKMTKNQRRMKYRIQTKEQGIAHVMPSKVKLDSFQEKNGRESAWTDPSLKLSDETRQAILSKARAIQFGNSVPDREREYLIYNLDLGISWMRGILPSFNITELAYAFGARGNAKSVAYYQDSKKLISVNRHNEGSLVHEIGHAIDYTLGKISNGMPWSIRSQYLKQLDAIANMPRYHKAYLGKPVEIFARLFEVYIWQKAAQGNGQNLFMLFCDIEAAHMPKLDAESLAWLESCLTGLNANKKEVKL